VFSLFAFWALHAVAGERRRIDLVAAARRGNPGRAAVEVEPEGTLTCVHGLAGVVVVNGHVPLGRLPFVFYLHRVAAFAARLIGLVLVVGYCAITPHACSIIISSLLLENSVVRSNPFRASSE
jgi:hypothetical protein